MATNRSQNNQRNHFNRTKNYDELFEFCICLVTEAVLRMRVMVIFQRARYADEIVCTDCSIDRNAYRIPEFASLFSKFLLSSLLNI